MLNPDGVSRGHYRLDTHALNLNRFYINPSFESHPSIYATRQVVLSLHNKGSLYLYCDLHAHANVKGCFVYGNSMEFRDLVEGRLFAKVLSLNSRFFEYEKCDFSETNISVDKGDGNNKEGAGRVALHKATSLPRCYTLECNYASGKSRNVLAPLILDPSLLTNNQVVGNKSYIEDAKLGEYYGEKIESLDTYTSESFEEIGEVGPLLWFDFDIL